MFFRPVLPFLPSFSSRFSFVRSLFLSFFFKPFVLFVRYLSFCLVLSFLFFLSVSFPLFVSFVLSFFLLLRGYEEGRKDPPSPGTQPTPNARCPDVCVPPAPRLGGRSFNSRATRRVDPTPTVRSSSEGGLKTVYTTSSLRGFLVLPLGFYAPAENTVQASACRSLLAGFVFNFPRLSTSVQ